MEFYSTWCRNGDAYSCVLHSWSADTIFCFPEPLPFWALFPLFTIFSYLYLRTPIFIFTPIPLYSEIEKWFVVLFFFGQSAFVDSFETLGDSFATEGSGRAQKGFLSMVDHSCAGGGWESSVQVCGFSFWHFRSPNCAGRHSLTLLMLALGGLNLIAWKIVLNYIEDFITSDNFIQVLKKELISKQNSIKGKMAGLKDVVTREYTINLHKRVCERIKIQCPRACHLNG